MTEFSDWIVITGDRKCDLPPDTKVQLMYRDDDPDYAEEHGEIDLIQNFIVSGVWWRKDVFAYRIVIEPVYKTVEYDALVSNGHNGRADLYMFGFSGVGESVPAKAKITFVDGKLVSGSWKVVVE